MPENQTVNPMIGHRVAYVVADPGIPVFGTKGASVHVQEIVRAWRSRGAHVEVFAFRRGEDVPADLGDVTVHVVKPRKTTDPAEREKALVEAAAELARRVADYGPDFVYERYALFSDVTHRVRRTATTVAAVLEVNAPLLDEQRTHRVLVDEPCAAAVLERQLAAADVTVCVSQAVADWVGARVPAGAGRSVVVAPNGVNAERITAVTPDPSAAPEQGVAVFVGTLKAWHGVLDLVRAASLARVPWRIRIIGDGPLRADVERLAADSGVDVEFVGAVPPAEVVEHLRGASVAVAPYPSSTDHYFSPLKVYEYGAAGLATVASGIGQIPQIIDDGVTGVLVPPSDPAALAGAIDALVADPRRAAEMGRAARDRMVRRHSWDSVLDRTLRPLAG